MEQTGQVVQQARQAVAGQLAGQKDRATGTLDAMVDVLHQASQKLSEQGQGFVAGYVDQAAGAVEGASGYLRERDVEALVGELEGFARRQPAWFLAGAFTLGLLGARFLKSSRSGMSTGSGGTNSWRPSGMMGGANSYAQGGQWPYASQGSSYYGQGTSYDGQNSSAYGSGYAGSGSGQSASDMGASPGAWSAGASMQDAANAGGGTVQQETSSLGDTPSAPAGSTWAGGGEDAGRGNPPVR